MAVQKPGETGDLFTQVRPRPLGVGELTRLLRAQVEPRFKDVWVAGEVSNLRKQTSGHLYFALKDDEASIGAGAAALHLQQVKERLQKDGLLDPGRKRALPRVPRKVGVATSPTGAALRDFVRVLHARFPTLSVLVAPCRVQGEGSAAMVASSVRALCRAGCDVIVVTRGGGSQDDLAAFNDERLARVIAACPVPVVSAVGHEVDISVADLVADVRAATPTHAAQLG